MCEHFDTAASGPSVLICSLTFTNVCCVMPRRMQTKTLLFWFKQTWDAWFKKIDIHNREALLLCVFKWALCLCVAECKCKRCVFVYMWLYLYYCNTLTRLIQTRWLLFGDLIFSLDSSAERTEVRNVKIFTIVPVLKFTLDHSRQWLTVWGDSGQDLKILKRKCKG